MAASKSFKAQVMGQFDQINNPRVARKDGSVVIKESYFYTFGKTAEDWAERVRERLAAAGIQANVRAEDHPARDISYWWAIVTPAAQ